MAAFQQGNMLKIVEESLVSNIKNSLIQNITNRLVAEFRENAESEVREMVENLSISGVKSMRDLAKMRDEVVVYCKWDNEQCSSKDR